MRFGFLFLLLLGLGSILKSQTCSVTIVAIPENCGLSCNGSATATGTGQAPFTYLWQPGGQTTQQVTGLCPGTYTVAVTDSLGCISIDSVIITTAPPLNVWISSITNPSCVGCSDGTATGSVNGGNPGYFPFWIPPVGQGLYTVNNLIAGTYTFCVTDTNGCTSCVDTVLQDLLAVPEMASTMETHALDLYDLTGRIVWTGSVAEWSGYDKNQQPVGIYVLVGLNKYGEVSSRRLISVVGPNW